MHHRAKTKQLQRERQDEIHNENQVREVVLGDVCVVEATIKTLRHAPNVSTRIKAKSPSAFTL